MIHSCKKPPVYFESTTGSFYSQYAGLPLKSCRVDLPVNQSGSGTPSPTNIRDLIPYTALDFTANGTVKTFTFGQTVYAGTLDVLTGKLSITHTHQTYNGSENWIISSTGNNYFLEIGISAMIENTIIANEFESIHRSPNVNYIGIHNTSRFIQLRPSAAELDLQAWKTWLNSNNLEVVYELATPITILLGGMEINTILGLNSLSSSVGSISAEYLKAGR